MGRWQVIENVRLSDIISAKEVVAEDVFGKQTNLRLVRAGTVLTNNIIGKLLLHGVNYVRIGDEQTRIQLDDSALIAPVTDTKEFRQFVTNYDGMLTVIRQEVTSAIFEGEVKESLILNIVSKLSDKSLTSNVLNFIRFIKQGDDAIYTHSLNVALLCNVVGTWLGFDAQEKQILTVAGMLHDIGKTRVPPEILYKEGRLTDKGFDEIKKHPIHGYRILQHSDVPNAVKIAALMHHEKIDGSGYPLQKNINHIDKITAVVSICDIYEAMTADRIYRARESPFTVLEQFHQGRFGFLHAGYSKTFMEQIANSFIGHTVTLSNGDEGRIVFLNPQNLSKPLIQCGDRFVDLSTTKNISITTML